MEERRKDFIKEKFKSVRQFALAVNDDPSNVLKVLKGQQKPEIQKLFVWATALECDIIQLLVLFYPKEMMQNIHEHNERFRNEIES